MSGLATPNDDSLSAADLEQVIAVCERFEKAWKVGRQHRIEDLQGEVPGSLRPRLFRELIAIELELRQARGERPGQEEYRVRFPDQAVAIGAIFAEVEDVPSWLSQPWTSDGRPDDDPCSTELVRARPAPGENGRNDRPSVATSARVLCGDGGCSSDRWGHLVQTTDELDDGALAGSRAD